MNTRITALDGLRGVAILSVLAFHFYYSAMPPRTAINYYPYNLGETILQYGRYGVELFFIISGFVISLTLHRCENLREFAVKRFARLWPSMVLCSVLTFLLLKAWPGPALQPTLFRNFLPSWTFLDPQLFTAMTGERFYWMDRAYWSLFVEVRFYAWAGLIYFVARERFAAVFAGWSALVFALYEAVPSWREALSMICVAQSLPWFLIGVALYEYEGPALWESWPARMLSWPPLVRVGEASYSLYLLHQHIGLMLIAGLATILGLSEPYTVGLPIVVTIGLCGLSRMIYAYWECPCNTAIVQGHSRCTK